MCHVPVIWGVVVVWFVIWACHFSLTCLSVNVLFCLVPCFRFVLLLESSMIEVRHVCGIY